MKTLLKLLAGLVALVVLLAGAGLAILDAIAAHPALKSYHLLPSVRGDFLAKLERHAEARVEFLRAASLVANERERNFLLKRASSTGA